MNILVTGHRGFIGSNMVKMLEEKKHNIQTFDWNDRLPNVRGLDWVIHMGANSSTVDRNVEKILYQNLDFSVWLLNQCVKHGVDFQFSSSASVYGSATDNFTEDAPVDPKTPYAWSKYLFERHVKNLTIKQLKGIRVQGFRYFNVYGPNEDHKGDQASPYHKFTKQAKSSGVIKLFEGSENYKRDFVPVESVVDMHQKFFDVRESGIWNVGTGRATSFADVARMVADRYNAKIEYIPMPKILQDSYQAYTCADMSKTHNSLQLVNQ